MLIFLLLRNPKQLSGKSFNHERKRFLSEATEVCDKAALVELKQHNEIIMSSSSN